MHELEVYSYRNGMRLWPWGEKVSLAFTALALSHRFPNPFCHLGILLFFSLLVCGLARVPVGVWLRFLGMSLSFFLLGSLVVVLDGSPDGLERGGSLFTRALAGFSTLGFLMWTIPPGDWCRLLRGWGVPQPLTEIALSMFQMIGVSGPILYRLRRSSLCRCGDRTWRLQLSQLSLVLSAFLLRLSGQTLRWERTLQLRGGMVGLSGPVSRGGFHPILWFGLALVWVAIAWI